MAQDQIVSGGILSRPAGWAGSVSALDARCREIEQALRQWVDALSAIKDPIFIHDREFRIVRANRAYEACAGMASEAFVGRRYWEVFPRGDGPLAACVRAIGRHEGQEEVEDIATADGRLFLSRSFPIYDGQGQYFHSVHIMEDVTQRRRIEDALRLSEEQHRQIVETSQEGIVLVDRKGQVTFVNPRLSAMLDRTEAEVLGRPFLAFLDPESRPLAEDCFHTCMEAARRRGKHEPESLDRSNAHPAARHPFDLKLTKRDGSNLWVMMSAGPMRDGQDDFTCMLGMLVDITDRKAAEEKLRIAAQVFDSTAESIIILDAERKVVDVNLAFTRTTGYTGPEILGRRAPLFEAPEAKPLFEGIWQQLADHDHWRGEVRSRRKGGETYPELLNISVVRDDRGTPTGYVVVFSDITDIKASQERFEYLANHDRITGLPNRNLFYDRLQHGLDKAARSQESLAVMFVDLDNFKSINDTLGHEVGDLLLAQVADRLRACTRRQDTVARLGGDEFTILAENLLAPDTMLPATAERVVNALAAPFDIAGQEILISASVGVALYPDNGGDLPTLLKNADTAMYQAKLAGKNDYQIFTEDMKIRAARQATLEQALRQALKDEQLSVVYQPQFDLKSGRVASMEALLRWTHPELGEIPPERFIPVAEATGLIVPIGEWVMRTVCRQLGQWRGENLGGFRVAVNLSARQFKQRNLVETIRRIVSGWDTNPTELGLELTEGAVMDDVDLSRPVLAQLKDMGIAIAIDDFGRGYSSLDTLKHFPIDSLKIGSHFMRDVVSDADHAAISTAIISMGHSLDMTVVAGGVESPEQMTFLQTRDCDLAQGYYLARPMPAAQAATMLRPAA